MTPLVTYEVKMSNGSAWRFLADLTDPTASLYLARDTTEDEDGGEVVTQYRTCDARHDASHAAALLWPIESAGDVHARELEIASVRAL